MNDTKKPTLTRELFEKSTSEEARQELLKIDAEYKNMQNELDNRQTIQDGHFFLGRLSGMHGEKDIQSYAQNRQHAQILLYDHYMDKAEKTYDHYHPGEQQDIREIFASNVKDTTVYTKSYNQGYYLFKSERQLSQKVTVAIKDKDSDNAQGLKDGAEQSASETVIEEHDSLENRYIDNSLDISRAPDRDTDKE